MVGRWTRALGVVALVAGGVVIGYTAVRTPAASAQLPRPRGGPIHGYVAAALSSEQPAGAVAGPGGVVHLPDITVVARDVATGALSPKVVTNPQGYFRTPHLAPGQYQICVSGPGYLSACDPQTVTVARSIHVLDHVVPIRPTPRVVWGTVWLADRVTRCFWFRPAFDTNAVVAAKVSLVDAGGTVVAGPVNGNSLGQFVLPAPAMPGPFKLRVVCEGAQSVDDAKPAAFATRQDAIIKNNPPKVVSFDVTKGGAGVRRAAPGDVLRATVTVLDLDGDSLHYRWTDDSGRALGLPDAPSVNWPLMSRVAVNTLHVQISDGKGGFAVARHTVRAGPNALLFSGTVFNRQSLAPVDQARVSLNGTVVQTDAAGLFRVTVPDAPRFVLNVSKSGFALSSRVYYGRNTGLRIPLDAATRVTLDAGKGGPVVLTSDRCEKGTCRPRAPLSLEFPPDALIGPAGQPYRGLAIIEGFQYDLSLPNPIPGDQGATYQGGTVRMATFGAFHVQPRGAAGQPLQLAANKAVSVSMPIDAELLPKAPAKIPFFHYEEKSGMWAEHGTLTRAGNRYTGAMTHFTAFNADTVFANSACVKVILDDSFTLPVSLDAVYVDPNQGVFYHNGTQATDRIVGIERMPPYQNFTLEIRDVTNSTLFQSVTLNSGPPLDPVQFPDGLVTDPNFDVCNGPVTVYNGTIPTGPTYLMPVTGGSIQDSSAAYRTATGADPGGSRDTFPKWLAANGFPDPNDAHAIYFNNGDLKFGRNMHCRVAGGGRTACYVSNYGNVGTDDSVTALADAANPLSLPVATVTMEHDPAAPNGENVQFWAYDGNGNYIQKAALDGQGAKPLPELCLACHGGSYSGTAGAKVQGAVFLPFDLDSFIYDPAADPHTSATVQEQFRQLNAMVRNTNPDTSTGNNNQPFIKLMNGWYPAGVTNAGSPFVFNTGATQLGGFPGHEPLYDNVVKPVCRTCHITRSASDDWTTFSAMNTLKGVIRLYACGSGTPQNHTTSNFAMPHAEVPFKKFWQTSLASTLNSELNLTGGCPNQ